jgi:non-ribosomal peptide synthetase component F/acyl carrier protein
MGREPGMTQNDAVLAVTTLSFDIAVVELILPLVVGARIVLADRTTATDGDRLRALVEGEGVTFLQATPSTWRLLFGAGWAGDTRLTALCGGEALPRELAAQILPKVASLWNVYGPTETTVWSSVHRVDRVDGTIPIGRPIANTQFHVCDEKRRLAPIGIVGELCISGDGVTDGYHNRPELTADRFVPSPDPTIAGRWYRTGDLGRWRPDGTLECLGRVDHQVKVRGYRIELGEIESQLLVQPGVQQALVVTREDVPGDVRIVAYIVPQGEVPDAGVLRQALGQHLPEYMLPQHFVSLPSIPLLPNGKIDRKALPDPGTHSAARIRQRVAPRSDVERAVLTAIEDVLRLPSLSVNDDFFDLGGHSLLVAKVTARLNQEFGLSLPLRTLFEARTAERLAEAVVRAQNSATERRAPIRHVPDRRSAPLTMMQERIRFIEELRPGLLAYNTPSAHRLKGPLDRRLFELAFREVVRRQPALRTYIGTGQGGDSAYAQYVVEVLDFPFPYEDLSALPETTRESDLLARMQAVIDTPIGISKAPLFRAGLYKLGEDHHAFLFMPHHIIWDGWSFDLLYEEIASAYDAQLKGTANSRAPLPVTYGDYAAWHSEWMQSADFDAELAYWKKRLAAIDESRPIKTDRPRRIGRMSGEGETEWVRVDKSITERLRAVAAAADVTLSTLTMAVFSGLLAEVADSPSVVLGVPVRGRQAADLENVMGFFNNLLPVQFRVDRRATMIDLARQIKQELLDVFSHQEVPFERLAQEPALASRAQKGGAYQALFSFQDARDRTRQWGNVAQSSILVFQKGATEDLGLWLMEVPNGLEGGLIYDSELFNQDTARAFRDAYVATLRALVADQLRTVSHVVDLAAFASTSYPLRNEREEPSVIATNEAGPLARRSPAELPFAGTVATIAQLWSELLGVDSRLLRETDSLIAIGAGTDVATVAAQRSALLLGFAMDGQRYAAMSLRQLAQAADALGTATPAPTVTNENEKALQAIWAELLELEPDQITGDDNFFDLGGSSLLAMRAIELSARSLGFRVDARRYLSDSMSQLARVPVDAGSTD